MRFGYTDNSKYIVTVYRWNMEDYHYFDERKEAMECYKDTEDYWRKFHESHKNESSTIVSLCNLQTDKKIRFTILRSYREEI